MPKQLFGKNFDDDGVVTDPAPGGGDDKRKQADAEAERRVAGSRQDDDGDDGDDGDDDDEPDRKPNQTAIDRRIGKEVCRRRLAEAKARELEARLAAVEQRVQTGADDGSDELPERPEPPDQYASEADKEKYRNEMREWTRKRDEKIRRDQTEELRNMRVREQIEEQQEIHDGSDGKPSYQDLFQEFYQEVASSTDPALSEVRKRLEQAANQPRRFYKEALKLYEARYGTTDRLDDDDDGDDDRSRDALRSPGGQNRSNGGKRSGGTNPEPTRFERMNARLFGGRVKPEDLARRRAAREGRS